MNATDMVKKYKYTPDNITKLPPNYVFIFGSNLEGKHFGGAAKIAKEKFGAIEGKGDGWQGNSYAFPTLDKNFKPRTEKQLKKSAEQLYRCVKLNRYYIFILTKVGCGIVGFSEDYMKQFFTADEPNLIKPKNW